MSNPRITSQNVIAIADVTTEAGTGYTHTFHDTSYEIDRVKIEAEWYPFDPDQPDEEEGWNIQATVQGWVLTQKGVRNKAIKRRERAYKRDSQEWASLIHAAAQEAYDLAVATANIKPEDVLGDKGRGTPTTLLR